MRRVNNNALIKKRQASVRRIVPTQTMTIIKEEDTKSKSNITISGCIINQQEKDKAMSEEQFERYTRIMERQRPKELREAYNNRNNQPYKNILPEEYFNKEYKTTDDLIVYKVEKDRQTKIDLKKATVNIKNNRICQDKELKEKYKESEEERYKKDFEYNNVKKYSIRYDEEGYEGLKENVDEYYKRQQRQMEKDKKSVDEIIEKMIDIEM